MTELADARRNLLASLDQLDAALGDNIDRSQEIRRRLRGFRSRIDQGELVVDLVAAEDQPRTVELLSVNLSTLETAGSLVRVRLARALRAEGQTIERIGELFGVTRQRVSALLRQSADS